MDRNSWISRLRVIWFDSMCCESKQNETQVTIDVPYLMYYSITSAHRMRRESPMPFAIAALHCLTRKEKQKWKAHDFGSPCVLCQSHVCVGVPGQSSFSQFLWLLLFFSLCASLGKVCFLLYFPSPIVHKVCEAKSCCCIRSIVVACVLLV